MHREVFIFLFGLLYSRSHTVSKQFEIRPTNASIVCRQLLEAWCGGDRLTQKHMRAERQCRSRHRIEPETKSRQWQVPQIKTLGQDSSCARCEPNHRDQSSDHRPCHVCSASAPLMTNPVKGRAVVLGQIRDDTITGNYTDNKSTCGRRNEVFTLSP